jgi:prolyl-tRNA editing enzyme YbaK/EbsC (Cys-tRNA(Pro) deacylase)
MEAAQPGTLLSSLQERIVSLERSSWMNGTSPASKSSPPSSSNDGDASGDAITPDLRRAKRHVQESRCHSSAWRLCPPDYYAIDLDERMRILGAHSTSQLCKACLFENRNFVTTNDCDAISMDAGGHDDDDDDDDDERGGGRGADPTNSRYYLIVVQYVESINVKKLASELRGLRPPGPRRFDPGYFADLRLAPEETSAKHTGYGHNGVSPFGMLDKSIPVIVCKSIMRVRPNFIWMGGGHKDWKLGMAVSEFIRGVNAIVLDVSEPRSGAA